MAATDEAERLSALHGLSILDTAPEPIFDSLTRLAALTFKAPVALVSLLDAERQWFKSCVGLVARETGRDIAFCDHAIRQADPLVVLDTTLDPRFAANPLVAGAPAIRFYAGAPLKLPSGHRLGTLCILDFEARADFSASDRAQLAAMAASVTDALVMRRDISAYIALDRERAHQTQLLAQAEEMSGVGCWSWDVAADAVTWSPALYRIHGRDPAAPAPGLEGVLSYYHPDDRAVVAALINRAVTHAEPYAFNARIIRSDGELRHVAARGACARDEDGRVTSLFGACVDVTDMKLADETLRANEARLQFMTEHSPDVILRTQPGRGITWVSGNCRQYGYEPADVIGRKTDEFIHPDDLDRVKANRASRHSGQVDPDMDRRMRFRRKDGGWTWLEGNPTFIRDETGRQVETINVLRDISVRMQVEEKLAASEARYRIIAESVTDIVSRSTDRGRITYLSPSVATVTGYSPQELMGQSLIPYMHPDDVEGVLSYYHRLVAGERPEGATLRYRMRHKAGHWLWLECNPTLAPGADGEPPEFIDVTRDVSAAVLLEAQLRAARDAAEAATAVKADFMANMSHEIRTPLTAILGFTRLLAERGDLSEGARNHVERVATAGGALLAIVNDVLDFSKLEAGQVEITPKPTLLVELLGDTLSMFESQAKTKGVALSLTLDAAAPAAVLIDPLRARQILINLIGNALKFTDKGDVSVTAAYDRRGARLKVRVADTGAGMTRAQQTKLFQRFSQVDASSTRRHSGTGLGLAICRGLVDAMGGDIGVKSRVGQGSVFHFSIAAPVAEAPPARQGDVQPAAVALEDIRVLVVDDNRANRDLARAILGHLGAEVSEAIDGPTALTAAAQFPVDVILMDIRMPGMDGPELLARIRATPGPNRDVPILAFTADADTDHLEGGFGFNGVVRKPLSPPELVASILRATAWHPEEVSDVAA